MRVIHPIPPFFDADSKILILGSFPSVKSREQNFFYGHPQNRFWRVIAALTDSPVPQTVDQKKQLLKTNHIALWDVIAECEIDGSADSSIRSVRATDIGMILNRSAVDKVFVNGKTAEKYYLRFQYPVLNRTAVCLPSTSPANAAWNLEQLIEAWSVIHAPCLS